MSKQIKRQFNAIYKPCKIDYTPLARALLPGYEKWLEEQRNQKEGSVKNEQRLTAY